VTDHTTPKIRTNRIVKGPVNEQTVLCRVADAFRSFAAVSNATPVDAGRLAVALKAWPQLHSLVLIGSAFLLQAGQVFDFGTFRS